MDNAHNKSVRLDLGCGLTKPSGFIGIDCFKHEKVDIVHDLNEGIPYPDSSVDAVRAFDFLEHLPDRINIMNEIWRVLKPGGSVEIMVPSTDGRGAFQDPTHVSFWNENSFWYFTDKKRDHLELGHRYGFNGEFKLVNLKKIINTTEWSQYDFKRKWKLMWNRFINYEIPIVHLHVFLECVKP